MLCNLSVDLYANDSTRSTPVCSIGVMGSAALLSEVVWLLTEEFLNGKTGDQFRIRVALEPMALSAGTRGKRREDEKCYPKRE